MESICCMFLFFSLVLLVAILAYHAIVRRRKRLLYKAERARSRTRGSGADAGVRPTPN